MYLKDYFPNVDKKFKKIYFSGISFISNRVKKDNIFFAIRGNNYDGNDFINEAIKKGAKVIVSNKKNLKKKDLVFFYTRNVRKLLAEVSYKITNNKLDKLVAVTGTNGKSSVADFFYQILSLNFKKVASIGTIGVKNKDKNKSLNNTTLDPIKLSKILSKLKKMGVKYVIMEASSHGLKQNRLDGLLFDVGIFTNLSHDHLDYHKTMRDYFNSKLYLFNNLIKKRGKIITDIKNQQFSELKKIANKKNLNLSLINSKKNGLKIVSHKFEGEKQLLSIRYKNQTYVLDLNLIGKVQINNVMMAILAVKSCGLNFKKIINVIKNIRPVEGRLEKVGLIKNNSKVILDYAHTPAALETALSNLRDQFPSSKISLLFGCGGNRDLKKRPIMGRIAERYSDTIYLTDDNPRNEKPSKIRRDIKKGIKKALIYEYPDRKIAINNAIKNLNSGDILLVAGKGHEKFQDYGNKKKFFSDRENINKSINLKNKKLSGNLKLNILKEQSNSEIKNNLKIRDISIDSRSIKKNDVFFAIKGKKIDGNNFVFEAFKKKSSLAIVNRFNNKIPKSKQIKVNNSLKFLAKCSSIFRENINAKIISITGSCGKTSLKEMIGHTLKKVSQTSFSPKSFNNKYGVPLSLLNLKQNDHFGILEVGMDKKGEIDKLTKIIKPNLGIITNVSYAHSENFKKIHHIAKAKAEIMNNIRKNGYIILNMDDNFFNYHRKIAIKKKLNVISFGIKNKLSMTRLIKIKKIKKNYELFFIVNGSKLSFYTQNKNKSTIYNILATLATANIYINIFKLNKNAFFDYKIPEGRGDISKIKLNKRNFNLIDEAYNSNPLSLKTALENYDEINAKNSKKYLILGDMLELGEHSDRQHKLIGSFINKTKINKVYVIGKYVNETFKAIKSNKKGKILQNKFAIIDLINKELNNNDYLMIKGSNSTGLNKITQNLKRQKYNVI